MFPSFPVETVRNRRVLIVDETCTKGKTISLVKEKVAEMDAGEIKSTVLYAHQKSISVPYDIGMITDALIPNQWDREI